MTRRRHAAAAGLFVLGCTTAGLAIVRLRGSDPISEGAMRQALDGRVGGYVQAAEARLTAARMEPLETAPARRIFVQRDERVHLDLTAAGLVRQVTLGRERSVNDTFTPAADDWTIDQAGERARSWLPRDAAPLRREPFVFRDAPAGSRYVFDSRALAAAIPLATYVEHGALGPSGRCAITYYQTTTGGVALVLIGLI